jgi:diguanylate cyclase (GGDEF)-like protein
MRMTDLMHKVRSFMSVPSENPELIQAQYKAFTRQIPLLYFTLLISTWALAYTFRDFAPARIDLYFPAALTLFCGARLIYWCRCINDIPTHEQAVNALIRTNRLTSGLTLMFVAWGILLLPYGEPYAQAHVAFYLATVSIACIFCLSHLRSAIVTITLIVDAAFIFFFALSGKPSFMAMSINIILVTVAMVVILMVNYRGFTRMVAAQVSTQKLSNQNYALANLDPLTLLPNRRRFFDSLAEAFERARRDGLRLVVGILDLDGFKPVNDLYGHATGDALLVEAGRRLADLCGEDIHLARLGGDEFALIMIGHASDNDLLSLGNKLCLALRNPFVLDSATVQVSGSMGFAAYPDLADNINDLFERADYALYHGKRNRRGRAVLFSTDHDKQIIRDARIEQALRAADLKEEITVLFQPIINVRTNETVAFEALARWNSPHLGLVPSGHFIAVAERTDTINLLTRILLKKALDAAEKWPENIRLSFNLSTKDICSLSGVTHLLAIISKSSFDPKRLDFEITETVMMHDAEQALRSIELLKSRGCGISLDDFGTGFSSLTQLHSLPLTKIKIDRSFVTDLHINPTSYKIVKSILALSRDMGLGCVVEGVETDDEMQALEALGCVFVQGYYFSKPLGEEAALAFAASKAPPVFSG